MRMVDTIVGTFLIGLAVLIVPGWFRSSPAVSSTTATVVRPWLETLRKGSDGFEYWDKGTVDVWPRITFYAVSAYEIVDTDVPHKVRIHSSTHDGIPIVKIYEVWVTTGGIYRVAAQGENPHL